MIHVYVSLQNDNRIARFQMNPDDGRLTHLDDVAVSDGPAPLAVNPAGTVLYVGHRGGPASTTGSDGIPRPEFALSSWAIDPGTGDLEASGRVHVLGEPCFISTDRRGKFVLSAYYQAGHCAVHPVNDSGALGDEPVEWRDTSSGAHSFQVDPSNRFAYVPHIADGSAGLRRLPEGRQTAANAIFQYRFDPQSGKLTPNDPPRVGPIDAIGPRHYCFHPTKHLVYVNNEQGSSVTVYALDPERGTLTAGQTISTLPDDATPENSISQIRIHPSGRFLYTANRGHDSIASFTVDGVTGNLTPSGWAEAERRPRAFNLDPTGRFLYAAGLETGNIAAFRIDPQTGALSQFETYRVGNVPMWVLFVELQAGSTNKSEF